MVVMLFPVSDDEPSLQPAALEKLARLGVTSIALLRDDSLAGLVLEGWAFHACDASRAARAVAGVCKGMRMLHPLAHAAVSSTGEANVSRREERNGSREGLGAGPEDQARSRRHRPGEPQHSERRHGSSDAAPANSNALPDEDSAGTW
jgi:hypothetical protein